MWIKLTARLNDKDVQSGVMYNTDNVVCYMPAKAGTFVFGLDGSRYPVVESIDQIEAAMADHSKGRR